MARTVSTIENRVAQTGNIREKAKNIGWLKPLTPMKKLTTWWLEQLAP